MVNTPPVWHTVQLNILDPIVLGDLNANIGQVHNPHSQQVADMLMYFKLVDLLHHFRQRWQLLQMNT